MIEVKNAITRQQWHTPHLESLDEKLESVLGGSAPGTDAFAGGPPASS